MLTVYSTPTCAPCRVVKARLTATGVPFEEVDLTTAPEALADLKDRLGVSLVQTPVLEHDGLLHNITALSGIIAAHGQ